MSGDPFARLRGLTQARVGLGRAGAGLPTRALLVFEADHARARDAVWAPFDAEAAARDLGPLAGPTVRSRAADRGAYLRDPDLGRRLDPADAPRLTPGPWDVAIVVADGLSAPAATAHGPPVARALADRLEGLRLAPVVVARLARVALGDEIGERLGARLAVMLLGERPGLSASDSLGAYLTFGPRPGRLDSERNCVSNIRPPHGLDHQAAADTLAWLIRAALSRGLTGVGLKDESRGPPALR